MAYDRLGLDPNLPIIIRITVTLMFNRRILMLVWLMLLAITLGNAFLAESADPSSWVVLIVCAGAALKGKLVIDRLMGLAGTERAVHWSMLSYFYLLPPVIAIAWLFPDVIERLTTL